jgi:hypothetical protein
VSAPAIFQQKLIKWSIVYTGKLGFRLFPVDAFSKKPVLPGSWPRYATRDRVTLIDWALTLNRVIWAVPLIKAVVVVDVEHPSSHDGSDGFASFVDLAGCHPDALDTWQTTTMTGGRHVWFKSDEHPFSNRTGKSHLAPGVEVKTEGGYVVLPPGPGRRWLKGGTIMPAPQWLKDQFKAEARARAPCVATAASDAPEHSIAGLAELLRHCEAIRTAPVGTRGSTRNAHGYFIAQLVGGGELEESDAWRAYVDASLDQDDPHYNEKWMRNAWIEGKANPARCDDFLYETPDFERATDLSFEEFVAAAERSTS